MTERHDDERAGGGGGGAAAPASDALQRLEALPLVGPGVKAAVEGLAGLGRDRMSSRAEARHTYPDAEAARRVFARRAAELLAPTAWSALSGVENADFRLHDAEGRAADGRRPARVGDYVRIDLPIVGLERCDWVRVERVDAGPDRVEVVVRPSADPTLRPPRPGVTAHFFTDEARNTFTLERDEATLIARVVGTDERANTGEQAASAEDALRHRILAEAGWGLAHGPQQHQWNRFTANLVAD